MRGLVSMCVAFALCGCLASPVFAASPPGARVLSDVAGAESVAITENSYRRLRNSWNELRFLLDGKEYAEAALSVAQVARIQRELGIRNFSEGARVLLRAARVLEERGEIAVAVELSEAAASLAPDLPHPHFHLARLFFDADTLSPADGIAAWFQGFGATWEHLPSRTRIFINLLLMLTLACMITALTVATLGVVRYYGLLGHDLRRLLPAGVTPGQGTVLAVLVLLAPIAFEVGWIYIALFWMAAVSLYMTHRERMVAVAVFVGVASLPFIHEVSERLGAFSEPAWSQSYRCLHDLCRPWNEALMRDALSDDSPFEATVASGVQAYRLAAVGASTAATSSAFLERGLEMRPDSEHVLVSLGNLRVAEAVNTCRIEPRSAVALFQEAEVLYRRVLERSPDNLAALYNLSILERRDHRRPEADEHYARAQELGGARLRRFEGQGKGQGGSTMGVTECPADLNTNQQMMESLPDADDFTLALLSTPATSGRALILPAAGFWTGTLGTTPLTLCSGVAMLILLLLHGAARRLQPAWICRRCGCVASSGSIPKLPELGICDTCFYLRIKGSIFDPKKHWLRERRIAVGQVRRKQVARFLSFVLPGAGQLLAGRPVAGTTLNALFSLFFLSAVYWKGPMRDGFATGSDVEWTRIVVCVGGALVVYAASSWGIYVTRRVR